MNKRQYNKKPWEHDFKSNRYRTSKLPNYGAVSIATLPATLGRPLTAPYDQGNTTRCTAYAGAKNGELMHGFPCSPDWQADKIGRLQGKPIDLGGANPNDAMDSQLFAKQGGHLPVTNWDASKATALDEIATNYSSRDYTKPDQGKDIFDGIKIGMYLHYDFNTKLGAGVQFFIPWYESFNNENITQITGNLLGYHSVLFDDWGNVGGNEVLYFYNSYGTQMSPTGRQTMTRAVVDDLLSRYGTSYKQPDELTIEQSTAAKAQTPTGEIWRSIMNIWYKIILLFYHA